MNADDDGFNLENQDGGTADRVTPVEGQPAAQAEARGHGLHRPDGRRGAAARPAARRGTHRSAPAREPAQAATDLPFLFRPGFLLVLGALVLAVLWAGGLFSGPAASQDWPWTLFQTDGGAVTFTWNAAHVFTAPGVGAHWSYVSVSRRSPLPLAYR